MTGPRKWHWYRVQPGDTLGGLARDQLGDEARWPELLELNNDLVVDADPTRPLTVAQVRLPDLAPQVEPLPPGEPEPLKRVAYASPPAGPSGLAVLAFVGLALGGAALAGVLLSRRKR